MTNLSRCRLNSLGTPGPMDTPGICLRGYRGGNGYIHRVTEVPDHVDGYIPPPIQRLLEPGKCFLHR